jgi:hypothetical protein
LIDFITYKTKEKAACYIAQLNNIVAPQAYKAKGGARVSLILT